MLKALVLRAPGINCDRETAQACRLVGFETELLHINQLLKVPDRLLNYAFLVIPGGFSYGDDLGAGTLLAKNLTTHLGPQLHQFIDEGRPVLGICNGFQVLVRAGLLPGHGPAAANKAFLASLTDNTSAQFECRWIRLGVQPSTCIFTQGIEHPIELPVAHGEGQFVLTDTTMLATLQNSGQIPLTYTVGAQFIAPLRGTTSVTSHEARKISAAPQGRDKSGPYIPYPDNPNGSIGNIAGVCNIQGNVFGLMPHPERYVHALQHPQRRGTHDGEGDGLLIFKNAYTYATKLLLRSAEREALGAIAPLQNGIRGEMGKAHPSSLSNTSYAASGVNIAAADIAKELMKDAVRATQGPEVLAGMGAFAGVFSLSQGPLNIQQMHQPALVASTDGVGTKTLIAALAGRFDTIGYDLVHHSVNDLLTQGARPLFFMDYLAMGKLDALQAATIVRSVAEACKEVGCALLGGETAEMPDVYLPGAFDLAGTIIGVVEQDAIVHAETICPGDVLLGLPSNGLHTNGYSLARRVFAPHALNTVFPELGEPLVDALLRPHRCYLREIACIRTSLADGGCGIKGMAHITGGGFEGNISRILPAGTQANIDTSAWRVPPLFLLISRLGEVHHAEMYRTLNMGVGMVLVLSPKGAQEARRVCPELIPIGSITEGDGVVVVH